MTPEKQRIAIAEAVILDPEDRALILSEGWSVYPVKKRNVVYGEMCRWNRMTKRQEKCSLHRFVIGARNGQIIAHLNGNGLDCRKSNLSIANHKLNGSSIRTKNKGSASKYRGVYINNGRGKKWTAMLWDNGKCVYLGRYDSEIEAAKTYDKEAYKRFGKFSHLNFHE
jgi:hypothetical protein